MSEECKWIESDYGGDYSCPEWWCKTHDSSDTYPAKEGHPALCLQGKVAALEKSLAAVRETLTRIAERAEEAKRMGTHVNNDSLTREVLAVLKDSQDDAQGRGGGGQGQFAVQGTESGVAAPANLAAPTVYRQPGVRETTTEFYRREEEGRQRLKQAPKPDEKCERCGWPLNAGKCSRPWGCDFPKVPKRTGKQAAPSNTCPRCDGEREVWTEGRHGQSKLIPCPACTGKASGGG